MRKPALLLLTLLLGSAFARPVLAQTGTLVVQVLDAETGRAIPRVKVRLPEKGLEAATAATGIATLAPVDTGTQLLEVEHPQRGKYARPVRVGPEGTAGVELRLPRVYAVEGLVVTARTPRELERRARAVRRDLIEREEITAALGARHHVGDLLSGRVPGVAVFEGTFPDEATGMAPSRRICIQMTRRVQQIAKRRQCSMVAVYVDGAKVADPGSFLLSLPLHALESVELIPPAAATARYGTNAGYGVLEIYTRGNGRGARP